MDWAGTGGASELTNMDVPQLMLQTNNIEMLDRSLYRHEVPAQHQGTAELRAGGVTIGPVQVHAASHGVRASGHAVPGSSRPSDQQRLHRRDAIGQVVMNLWGDNRDQEPSLDIDVILEVTLERY